LLNNYVKTGEEKMKVLLCTDVLRESILPSSATPDDAFSGNQFLDKMTEGTNHSLWLSALSVGQDISSKLLNGHKKKFTIIPLRQSTLIQAEKNESVDFETRILIASAEELQLNAIVCKDPSRFNSKNIPVLTPGEFFEKQETGDWDKVESVPFLDLKAQHHLVYNDIDNRFTDIIANTGFILGHHVEEFEEKFAKSHHADFCLGVSSGTDALHIALKALNIGPGDGVVVPVNTFIATAEAVSLTGATPVFADCDQYYNIDVNHLEALLKKSDTPIRAVIPVHLYGQPADMAAIQSLANEYDFVIVEDACQAHLAEYHGKKTGTFGQFSAFSFYPGKNLGAYGEAGAILTNDETLFTHAKMIRQHGEIERYHHSLIGHNYRMSAIQGAVLNSKLPYLAEWTEKRRKIAAIYNTLLDGTGDIIIPKEIENAYCVYHLYVIQTEKRDALRTYLQEKGISTGLHYPVPLHLQKAYKELGYQKGDFPEAEKAALKILSLPMFPELTRAQVQYVCDNIRTFFI
jgi:dTDP-4-amino-4,6-dideoxygalactose transaminase